MPSAELLWQFVAGIPIAVAWIRSYVRSCGIIGGQSGTAAGLFRVLRFPLPVLILSTAPRP
jgi:hypothetical protein